MTGRPKHLTLVVPEAPLPAFRRPSTPLRADLPPATATPANIWESAIGRELAADREKITGTLDALRRAADQLQGDREHNLTGLQNAAVELSLTIAAQLLHRVVAANEFPVENMVRDMAAQMVDESAVTIHLNPDDLKLLERRLAGAPLLSGSTTVKLNADSTLKRCECRVEGAGGSLLISDAARQLQEIREELLRNLAHARNART